MIMRHLGDIGMDNDERILQIKVFLKQNLYLENAAHFNKLNDENVKRNFSM